MNALEIEHVINQAIWRSGHSEKSFSKAAGIGVNTLNHFHNTKNLRLNTLILICDTLGLEVVVRREKGK